MVDRELLALLAITGSHFTVRHFDVDEATGRENTEGTFKHPHGVFDMLQDFGERDDIESPYVGDFHEIAAKCVGPHPLAHVFYGACVGIDGRAIPPCALNRMGEYAKARTNIE